MPRAKAKDEASVILPPADLEQAVQQQQDPPQTAPPPQMLDPLSLVEQELVLGEDFVLKEMVMD